MAEERELEYMKLRIDSLENELRQMRPRAVDAVLKQDGNSDSPPKELVDFRNMMADVYRNLAKAMARGHFMVVVFSSENGVLYTDRHNHGIVESDFELAQRELARNLRGESGPPPDPTPLPRARLARPKPMDLMLGKRQEDPAIEAKPE